MSPNCDHDLEDTTPPPPQPFFSLLLFLHDTPVYNDESSLYQVWFTKSSAVQKISQQTLTEILNIWCDHDIQDSNPVFLLGISVNDNLPVWLQKND